MKETIDKFTEKLKKLDKYCILSQKNETYIIGTTVTILELQQKNLNSMSPFIRPRKKEIGCFFVMVTPAGKKAALIQELMERKTPIFTIQNSHYINGVDHLEKELEDFIYKNFLN